MAESYPDELEADFQQYYGLDAWAMTGGTETTYDVLRAASLCAQLPGGSRVRRKYNPDEDWGLSEQLLRLVEYDVRSVLWAVASKKGTKPPKPLELPSDREKRKNRPRTVERERAEVDAVLANVLPDAKMDGGA